MRRANLNHLGTGILTAAFLSAATAQGQNVGIGTTTPRSKLSVNGSTASGGLAIGDAGYTSTAGIVAPSNGAIIQGDVGIGTAIPTAKLDVENGDIELSPSFAVRWGADSAERIYSQFNLFGDSTNDLFIESRERVYFVADRNDTLQGIDGAVFVWASNSSLLDGTPTEHMHLTDTGNLGIGDSQPTEAKLVVRGGISASGADGQRFTPTSSGFLSFPSINFSAGIYASNAIVTEGFLISGNSVVAANSLTFSDSRLKNVQGLSDSSADLKTLEKIRITDYTMKEASALGNGRFKKVIAQEVEAVYPQAVTEGSGYLPDVNAAGTVVAQGEGLFEIRLDAPHGLSAGTKVKLLHGNGEAEFVKVESADEKTFTAKIGLGTDGEKILVYGRQVNDLRSVDYDALSMLNISATQELAKNIEALKAENAGLRAQVADLKVANDKLNALSSEMAELKLAVAAMRSKDEGPVRTVSISK